MSSKIPIRPLEIIRRWIPPGLRDLFNAATGYAIVFEGVFDRWEDAERAAKGYDENSLLRRIESAAQSVKNGEAAWEQDGVTHDAIPPDFPQLACLSQVAMANDGALTVLDFGGAFGSSYHQAREYLLGVKRLRWHIVEQPALVAIGREKFQSDELLFNESIDACTAEANPDVILLSGTLHYLPDPYRLLDRIAATSIPFLIIDRSPETMTRELITIQKLPPRTLYPGSYASWLFDSSKIDAALSSAYEKQMAWAGKDPPIRGRRGIGANYVGSFWRRRPNAAIGK